MPLNEQTYSWIFLATAMASETEPANFSSISTIADGINHAVPTHKELQTSLAWLTGKGLVTKIKNKYSLSEKGNPYYNEASKAGSLPMIWKTLEEILKNQS